MRCILRNWTSKNESGKQLALMLQESRELVGRDISRMEQRLIQRIEAHQDISKSRHLSVTSQLQYLQWSNIMQRMSSTVVVDSLTCLNHCKVRYKQLLASGELPSKPKDSKELPQRLQSWADSSESTFIYLKESPLARGISQGLAIKLVDLLHSSGAPVIWALNSHQKDNKLTTTIAVIKNLVLQGLRINPCVRGMNSVDLAAIYNAQDEEQWLKVLRQAQSGMLAVFIIFDLDVLESEDENRFSWLQALMDLFEQLKRRSSGKVLRVCFISCKYASASASTPSSIERKCSIDVAPLWSRSQVQSMTQSPSRNRMFAARARASNLRGYKREKAKTNRFQMEYISNKYQRCRDTCDSISQSLHK